MSKRRFELVEGSSSKFWEIGAEGSSFTVTFGRIGSAGQTKTKKCKDASAAAAQVAALVAEKVKKGYSPTSAKRATQAKPAAQLKAVSRDLAQALDAAAGNVKKERAAMKLAIAQFMKIRGAPADADPAEYMCAEFFAEGDDKNDSVFDQMKNCDDDDQERLWELLADVAGY